MDDSILINKPTTDGHVCVFYEDELDLLQFLVFFFEQGIRNRELCLLVTAGNVNQITEILAGYSYKFKNALAKNRIRVLNMDETYLPDGVFDGDVVINSIKDLMQSSKAQGFRGLRAAGDMSWLHEHSADIQTADKYEIKLNEFYKADANVVIACLYPVADQNGDISLAALKSHPYVYRKDTLSRNYIYRA